MAVEMAARPEIQWSLAPATSLEASAAIVHRQYLTRYGGFFNGRAQLRMRHRDSEYLSLDARLAYAREFPTDALTDSADFAIDSISLRETFSARASLDWSPDALTSVTTSVGWESLDYPDSKLLVPTRALNGDVDFSRRLSETTSLGLHADVTRTQATASGTVSARSMRATIEHELGPGVSVNGQVGAEWADALAGGEGPRIAGSTSLCYRPPSTDACLSASIQSEISGFGGLQRQLYVGGTFRRQISERSSLGLVTDYRTTSMSRGAGRATALRLSGTFERRLTGVLSLIGAVGYFCRRSLTGERNEALVLEVGISIRGNRR